MYPNLVRLVGVELMRSRFDAAVRSCRALQEEMGEDVLELHASSNHLVLSTRPAFSPKGVRRTLEMHRGNIFEKRFMSEVPVADIVICEADIPASYSKEMTQLLCAVKPSGRFLLYNNPSSLPTYRDLVGEPSGFDLAGGRCFTWIAPGDAYPANWNPQGHHFFLARPHFPTPSTNKLAI